MVCRGNFSEVKKTCHHDEICLDVDCQTVRCENRTTLINVIFVSKIHIFLCFRTIL